MKNPSILPSIGTSEQKTLLLAIKKRRLILTKLLEKFEKLESVISTIKNEYAVRIGHLFHKDTMLDIEIIRHKKITELMDLGLSYKEAVNELKENLKRQQEEYAEAFDTFEDLAEEIPDMQNEVIVKKEEVRKLWKKLVQKFHPDLSINKEDRKNRELIMKKINSAYAENDFDNLKEIEANKVVEDISNKSVEKLQVIIIDLENAILRQKEKYHELTKSEWHSWIKKSQKEKEALFSEMEEKILSDLIKKRTILDILKKKYHIETI